MDDVLTLDSVEAVPPDFGPQLPYYPQINQFCRVSGRAQMGNVYPGFISQAVLTGLPSFRDRESCFVWEPNGISLSAGWYDCRLVGSYQGIPLLVTNCCPSGSSSSSSSAVGH